MLMQERHFVLHINSEPGEPACFLGKTTVNSLYGSRVAVLVGDYLFAQSSWFLANLDNLEVLALPHLRFLLLALFFIFCMLDFLC